jgi:hypothetical protein
MTEVVVGALEAADGFAMFRKLAQDRMMQVHGSWSVCVNRVEGLNEWRMHVESHGRSAAGCRGSLIDD